MPGAHTQTMMFNSKPMIAAQASIVGPKEGEGPLGWCFDQVVADEKLGEKSWEMAESKLMESTVNLCITKGGLVPSGVELLIGGDLINQITPTSFAARELCMPFIGVYGACSTIAESTMLGAALVNAGYRANAVCATSSHFCTAERQFRFPLALGNQRTPSSQRTATASGAVLVTGGEGPLPRVGCATVGRVVDYEITDTNHMGAAMAPAAADTLCAHFRDTGRSHQDYDLIVTGDLGSIGRELLGMLMQRAGMPIPDEKLFDCGAQLFSPDQDAHAGGSGCGCLASVLCGLYIPKLIKGEVHSLLFVGTGALLSPISAQQGESIPCIAHAVALEGGVC